MSVPEFRQCVRVLVVDMFPLPSSAVIMVVYSASLWICDICSAVFSYVLFILVA
jgi:hypothetical protein